jgi:hypothetical protein
MGTISIYDDDYLEVDSDFEAQTLVLQFTHFCSGCSVLKTCSAAELVLAGGSELVRDW